MPRFMAPRREHAVLASRILLLLALPIGRADSEALGGDVSFTRDVMAVFSKAGCNMGACHGNQNGKGGFYLSLRGQDPAFDFRWVTHESGGRRVDRLDPEQSLILLKPTGRLSHQGGVRFREDSLEYELLREWVRQGAPGPDPAEAPLRAIHVTPLEQVLVGESESSVALQVIAEFADGQKRDVTRLATYELGDLTAQVSPAGVVERREYGETTVLVRYLTRQAAVRVAFVPDRKTFVWSNPPVGNYIDELVYRKLRTLRINPSELADDHTWIRRAYLDALGILPTAQEAQAFAADPRPDKRERWVETLLARPEFADAWALKWSDVLRNEEKVLDPKGVDVFHAWIRESIASGKPMDQFVRELVRGTGSTYDNPPANYYRANRDPSTRAETTARLFLGVRLQCARCHNHPFDKWTQDDYYSWSAIFARIDYEILENNRRDRLDKNEFNGEQIVRIANAGSIRHPNTGQLVSAKLLGGPKLLPGSYVDRLTPLAVWLTSPENKAFARAQVNFVWYHLMGRGLVEPIDDVRETNPASNEPLLEALAEDFVAGGFDLRQLVRTIMTSRTYQLSSVPNETNVDDETNFSRAIVQRLPAEKLLDAQCQVLGAPAEFSGYPLGTRAGQIAGVQRSSGRRRTVSGGDRFLRVFGKPERLLACECERSNETALTQAFALIGGDEIQYRITRPGNRIERLAVSGGTDEEVVEQLYWSALARPPSSEELAAALELIRQVESGSPAEPRFAPVLFVPVEVPPPSQRVVALQDLAWALLNSKEFIFRH